MSQPDSQVWKGQHERPTSRAGLVLPGCSLSKMLLRAGRVPEAVIPAVEVVPAVRVVLVELRPSMECEDVRRDVVCRVQ